MRATLAAIVRQTMGVPKSRQPRLHVGWFLLATFFFMLPPRAFAAVTIAISPAAVNLPPNGSQQFTATVTGASGTSVTWTIREGTPGGTINNGGLYSAPGVLGTYHVVATSNADSTQSATATVAVPGFIHAGLLYPGSCTATLLPNGTVLYTGGQPAGQTGGSFSETDNAEIYDPVALTSTPTGNMTIPRCDETATLLPNGKVLFAGGQTSGAQTSTAELYDPVAGTFTVTGSMSVARIGHTATLLPNGTVLIAGGYCGGANCFYNTAELYDPNSGTFTFATGTLVVAASNSSATLLQNGMVLIAGGFTNGGNGSAVAELYDPSTGLFTQTGMMVNARAEWFTATLLQNGNVLFAGGLVGGAITSSAEIYAPSTGTFAPTGSLNIARNLHTASALLNGQVLIAGGRSTLSRPASAELYDPGSGTFTLTGSLGETRFDHTATALANGTVLIAAGTGGQLLDSIETYDPAAGIFNSQDVFMKVPRTGHSATQLADGRVLLIGGQDAYLNVNSSAEIYDPATGNFSLTGSLIQGRYGHTATLLGNGNVLVVGGYSDSAGTNIAPTAELYNPASGTFGPTSSPIIPRAFHTATLLQNGMVLIAGGQIGAQQTTASVELYNPSAETFTLAGNMSAPRYNHTATLLNDGRVLIAEGVSGFPGVGGNQVEVDDLYNPSSGAFTQVGPIGEIGNIPTIPFDSVLLASGQVLVDEGTIFDPNSNTLSTFNPVNSFSVQLQNYKFVLLPNNQVFVAGGQSAAYLFDPNLEAYSPAGTMEYYRLSPSAKLLSNGEVLIAGGAGVAQAEFYVPPASSSNTSPILSLINPASTVAGGSGFTLTVYGFNFINGSVVNFNGVARQTTYLSATQLSMAIATSDIANAGTATITVTNPVNGSGGGGTSNPVILTITGANVQPVVGALSPASATAGGPSFTLSLSGDGFTAGSVVSFNGNTVPSTFSSAVEIQAAIPASAIAVAGTPVVTVANPGSLPSLVATFTVNNPVPQENALSPLSDAAGSAALSLNVTGTNFNTSSGVLVNGAPLTTTYVSSTLLEASLPASDSAQAGTLNVSVKNPPPGGGTTAALPFTVSPVTTGDYIVTAQPSSATLTAGQTATFSLTVAPANGTYANPITLTVSSVLPAGATASFAPSATITLGKTSQSVELAIATAANMAASPNHFPGGDRQIFLLPFPIGMAFALAALVLRSSCCRVLGFVPQHLWVLALASVAFLVACSGTVGGTSSSIQSNTLTGTPAGTYTVTVTATSGAISHSTSVTLIVM